MKVVIYYINNKPIAISKVADIKDGVEFAKIEQECKKNIIELKEQTIDIIKLEHALLERELKEQKKRIKAIERELAYNRGELTEQEYKGGE